MKIIAEGDYQATQAEFDHQACEELMHQNWDAVEFINFYHIGAIVIHLYNTKVSEMTLRQILERTQQAIDFAHHWATGWNWFHFDVERI